MSHFLIVDVSGGGFGIIEQLLSDGHTFTFLTQDMNVYLRGVNLADIPLSKASDIVVVHPFNYDVFEMKVLKIHAINPFHGILCAFDWRIKDLSRIAAKLSLPFLRFEVGELLNDKYETRKKLEQTSVLQPKFFVAENEAEVVSAVEKLGFPVVVKPTDGFASINVFLIYDQAQLESVLKSIDWKMNIGMDQYYCGRYLVEELITGPVVSCEIFSKDLKHQILGITDRLSVHPNSPVEFGGCFPSTRHNYDRLIASAVEMLDKIGFNHGPSHIEFIMADDGPYLVEINARLIGGVLPKLLAFATGRSIYQDLLNLYSDPNFELQPFDSRGVACIRWVCTEKTGVFNSAKFNEPWPEYVVKVENVKNPGIKIRPPQHNGDRIAYVMTLAPSQDEAEAAAAAALDSFVIDIAESLPA